MSITCLEDLLRVGSGRVLVRIAAAAVALADDPAAALHRGSLKATVDWLHDREARVVLATAVAGDDGAATSLAPVVPRLAAALRRPVRLVGTGDLGRLAEEVDRLPAGEVALLENLAGLPSATPEPAARLAAGFTHYVDDAFAESWQRHPLLSAAAQRFDRQHRALGRHMQNEVDALACLLNRPDGPFVSVIGGPCLVDVMVAMETLLLRSDRVILGGGVAAAVLNRMGLAVSCPTVTDGCQVAAGELLAGAAEGRVRLVVPSDLVVETASGEVRTVPADAVPPGATMLDLGPTSCETAAAAVRDAETVFWHGAMGRGETERPGAGSAAVAAAVAGDQGYSVVAGDDTLRVVHATGHAPEISHLSTGGLAALLFIAGRELPGLAAMED